MPVRRWARCCRRRRPQTAEYSSPSPCPASRRSSAGSAFGTGMPPTLPSMRAPSSRRSNTKSIFDPAAGTSGDTRIGLGVQTSAGPVVDCHVTPAAAPGSRAAPRPRCGNRRGNPGDDHAGSQPGIEPLLSRMVSRTRSPGEPMSIPARMSLPPIAIEDPATNGWPTTASSRSATSTPKGGGSWPRASGSCGAGGERSARALGAGDRAAAGDAGRRARRPVPGVPRVAGHARRDRRLPRPPRLPRDRRAAAAAPLPRDARALVVLEDLPTSTTWGRWPATPPRSAPTRWCCPRAAPIRSTARRSASRWARCFPCPSCAPPLARRSGGAARRRARARRRRRRAGRDAARRLPPPARFALVLGAEGPGSVRGGARRAATTRHHPDVGGRRLAQRRDGRRDFSVCAGPGASAAGASLRRSS